MKKIFIKPIEGVIVRNPKSKEILPKQGLTVDYNTYWRRRLKDGSVVISKPEKIVKTERPQAKYKEDRK